MCKTHSGEQKTILLFHISPSANEIIRLKNGEAFLRVGDQSRKLSADMLSSLEFSKGIKSYESKIVEDATYEDLDEKLIAQYTNLLDPSASSSFDLLKGRGIIKEKTEVFKLLLLLFFYLGNDLHSFYQVHGFGFFVMRVCRHRWE